ncbi:MAG: hypothetical protein MHM6MM_000894 [Cercozoa sp. M6MM]
MERAELPWIEKYRPRRLEDVAHQEDVVAALQNTLATGNLPHLLFYGPPGTGKTSTILAAARQLFGPKLWRSRVKELNASDERGIAAVRHQVKTFAQTAVGAVKPSDAQGAPCPPFKIIILDEADQMTRDAQTALRRTMEKYSRVTRFCLVCNYVSRIIAPVASRCAKFRFQSLPAQAMSDKLRSIAAAEQVPLSDGAVEALLETSGGDMRKSIQTMQSARMFSNAETQDEMAEHSMRDDDEEDMGIPVAQDLPQQEVTAKHVQLVAVDVDVESVRIAFETVLKAPPAHAVDTVLKTVESIVRQAAGADGVLRQLVPLILESTSIAEAHKARLLLDCGRAEHALRQGGDEALQLTALFNAVAEATH